MKINYTGGGSSEPASYQDVTTVADVSYQVTFDMTRLQAPVAGKPPSIGYCKVIDVFTGATLMDEQFYVEGLKTVSQALEFTASGTSTRIILGTIYVLVPTSRSIWTMWRCVNISGPPTSIAAGSTGTAHSTA